MELKVSFRHFKSLLAAVGAGLLAICLTIFIAVPAHAEPAKPWSKSAYQNGVLVPPEYLFHWTPATRLNDMARRFLETGKFPLKATRPNQELRKHTNAPEYALYTWAHPTAAMATHDGEIFADYSDIKLVDGSTVRASPKLLTLKIRRDSKIFELRSGYGIARQTIPDGIDLIYHIASFGNVSWKEWIVVNPEAVEWYTADPKALPKEIKAEIRRTASGWHRNGDYEINQSDRYSHTTGNGAAWVYQHQDNSERALEYLNENVGIPEVFRGLHDYNPTIKNCKSVFIR